MTTGGKAAAIAAAAFTGGPGVLSTFYVLGMGSDTRKTTC